MQATAISVLPPRLGQNHLELLERLAAPCTIYHVHPGNVDRIPCFVSGYKVFALAGSEERGVVVLHGGVDRMCAQRTDAASGVASQRPCFVPIDGMHRAVHVEAHEQADSSLLRVKVLAFVDEYGVVQSSSRVRDGFPGAGQEAYLFSRGIHHRASAYPITADLTPGVTLTGLFDRMSARLTPLTDQREGLVGIPVLSLSATEPVARLW